MCALYSLDMNSQVIYSVHTPTQNEDEAPNIILPIQTLFFSIPRPRHDSENLNRTSSKNAIMKMDERTN